MKLIFLGIMLFALLENAVAAAPDDSTNQSNKRTRKETRKELKDQGPPPLKRRQTLGDKEAEEFLKSMEKLVLPPSALSLPVLPPKIDQDVKKEEQDVKKELVIQINPQGQNQGLAKVVQPKPIPGTFFALAQDAASNNELLSIAERIRNLTIIMPPITPSVVTILEAIPELE